MTYVVKYSCCTIEFWVGENRVPITWVITNKALEHVDLDQLLLRTSPYCRSSDRSFASASLQIRSTLSLLLDVFRASGMSLLNLIYSNLMFSWKNDPL